MKLRFYIFLFGVLIINKELYSAQSQKFPPSIIAATSTGNVTGALLTIVGSGFGTKKDPRPQIWLDANISLKPSSKGQQTSLSEDYTMSRISTASLNFLDSNSFVYTGQVNPRNTSASFRFDLPLIATYTLYGERGYNFSYSDLPNQGNLKRTRLWPSFGNNDWVCSSVSGGQCLNEVNTDYPSRFCGAGSCAMNKWVKDTMEETWMTWSHGSSTLDAPPGNVSDGTFKFIESGFLRVNLTDTMNGSLNHTQIRLFDNFCSDCFINGQVYENHIYFDDTFSSVRTSTTPILDQATDLQPCLGRTWDSSGQLIICEIYRHQAVGINSMYVFVTDDQNLTNANGFRITTQIQAQAAPYMATVIPIKR